jgi:ATP-dependent Clp protease ATP-binding subunit ClpA
MRERVTSELRKMLSSAFFSRMGEPIVFSPLRGEALVIIIGREVEKAVRTGARRLGLEPGEIVVEKGVGALLLPSLRENVVSGGARTLLRKARDLVSAALLRLPAEPLPDERLVVNATPSGEIIIRRERR